MSKDILRTFPIVQQVGGSALPKQCGQVVITQEMNNVLLEIARSFLEKNLPQRIVIEPIFTKVGNEYAIHCFTLVHEK